MGRPLSTETTMTYAEFISTAEANQMTTTIVDAMAAQMRMTRQRNWSDATFAKKLLLEVRQQQAAIERNDAIAAEAEAYKAELAARAADRADFDAWAKRVSSERMDNPDYHLLVAYRRAVAGVEAWDKYRAEFIARLEQDPCYAFSWAGNAIEAAGNAIGAAADRAVSLWVIEGFKMGCSGEVMAKEALRETLRRAKNGNGRSTSTLSNLTDDVMGMAWTKAYERLSGETFW